MKRVEENRAGVLVDNDDAELVDLLASAGFVVGDEDGATWMDAAERCGRERWLTLRGALATRRTDTPPRPYSTR